MRKHGRILWNGWNFSLIGYLYGVGEVIFGSLHERTGMIV